MLRGCKSSIRTRNVTWLIDTVGEKASAYYRGVAWRGVAWHGDGIHRIHAYILGPLSIASQRTAYARTANLRTKIPDGCTWLPYSTLSAYSVKYLFPF